MLPLKLTPDFVLENEKGSFVQLVHKGWNQINVLRSPAGSQRGGHYHRKNREAFYIVSGRLRLTLERGAEMSEAEFGESDFFLVEPLQKHSFAFLEDTVMVSMYDIGVENADGTKDIFAQ